MLCVFYCESRESSLFYCHYLSLLKANFVVQSELCPELKFGTRKTKLTAGVTHADIKEHICREFFLSVRTVHMLQYRSLSGA